MRKIILCLAVSLDGFIEGPNGEIDWMVFDEETADALNSFIAEIDTILYGRISYEKWGDYQPSEETSQGEKDFYNKTAAMEKYVFSTSRSTFEGNPHVIQSDIIRQMEQLKNKPGHHIWLFGGAALITSFVNAGLIDEFRIAVIPIILTGGKSMFKDIQQRVKLQLLRSKSSKLGVVELVYAPAR